MANIIDAIVLGSCRRVPTACYDLAYLAQAGRRIVFLEYQQAIGEKFFKSC
jgi:hypothetical protein